MYVDPFSASLPAATASLADVQLDFPRCVGRLLTHRRDRALHVLAHLGTVHPPRYHEAHHPRLEGLRLCRQRRHGGYRGRGDARVFLSAQVGRVEGGVGLYGAATATAAEITVAGQGGESLSGASGGLGRGSVELARFWWGFDSDYMIV